MTFGEMATDLERLCGTDLQYYAGNEAVDTGIDFDVERRRLLNWAIKTVSKLVYIFDPAVTFVPVESQAFYILDPSTGQGLRQEVYLGEATGGTFTLTFDGTPTSAIQWNDSAATVQTRLINDTALITGDVTVTATTLGFRLAFAQTYASQPVPSVSITSSLTGTTGTPSVKRQAFGKRIVKCLGFQLDDVVVCNDTGRRGLWNASAFEQMHAHWRSDETGTPTRVVDRGHQVQLHVGPDSDFLLASANNCFALAQVLLDDMQTDGGDDNSIVELDSTLHEGIPMLASFRAADPVTDEDGALRRLMSMNQRWAAEANEIRKRNRNAVFETVGLYRQGRRVPA